jgi:Ca2+/H+ antiporter, TMEM165/GDT1 family
MTMARVSLLVLSLFCLVSLLSASPSEWFNTLDGNHDGAISKDEFDQGLLKIDAALGAPLDPSLAKAVASWLPDASQGGFWKGFTSGVAMIIATEIGDKTFFIAAVLSMRHARSAVFGGAIVALIIMTILSTCMGLILPNVLPKQYTHLLGGVLFLYFGVKLIVESRGMEKDKVSEELEEVEEELLAGKKTDSETPDTEAQHVHLPNKALTWTGVFLQSLTLTFLAEWGDRSQIATIALAAAKNPYGVTVGGCLGHSLCTGLAVMGGRMLASKISEKTVSFCGGCIFLVFGLHSIFFEN